MDVLRSIRGDIKLFETIGVLIVFLILLGFAIIFYNFVQKSSFEQELQKIAEGKSQEISEKALLLPELDCSLTGITEINCIDLFKLKGFGAIVNGSLDAEAEYFTVFETSEVVVRQLWPPSNASIVLYNKTPEKYRSKTLFASPILLRQPLQNANIFGIIEVTTYAKT